MLLAKKYIDLDFELARKKEELEAKLIPLFQQFVQETGLTVNFAKPIYIESTAMGDDLRQFLVTSIRLDINDSRSVTMGI
jgi:hypothetical protein